MAQLRDDLGSPSRRTVFRLLKQLPYLSSYSHRGSFYALRECADFDSDGLWRHGSARFSRHGTLLATVEVLAATSPAGLRATELQAKLGVQPSDALRKLTRQGRLTRVLENGQPLFCAPDADRRRVQQAARRAAEQAPPPALPAPRSFSLAAACALFASLLNEKQRRLFAGLLSMLYGYGGDTRAAAWVGLHTKTVRRGRRELARGKVDRERVRKPGGGRKPIEKKTLH